MLDANVNLMMHNATVSYDPAVASPDGLVETIRATGYGAEIPPPDRTAFDEQAAQDAARAEELADLERKAAVNLAVAAVAMIVSMPLMTAGAHTAGDPFMRWTMRAIGAPLEHALPGSSPRARAS